MDVQGSKGSSGDFIRYIDSQNARSERKGRGGGVRAYRGFCFLHAVHSPNSFTLFLVSLPTPPPLVFSLLL